MEELTLPVANGISTAASAPSKNVSSVSSTSSSAAANPSTSSVRKEKEKNTDKNYEKKGSFHDFHEAMDASLLKEKDKEKDRERRSKLNNSSQIVASNHTNNNAHIKQRNNIHSNSSNEAISPPSEHVLRLEADIKRLKADLQVTTLTTLIHHQINYVQKKINK